MCGHKALASLLKFLIETKIYNNVQEGGIIKDYLTRPVSNIIAQIQQNFITKMEDIKELKIYIGIMKVQRHMLLKNIFNETNF